MLKRVLKSAISRIDIIDINSIQVELGEGWVAALNLIEVFSLQIHPMPDLIEGVLRFWIEASV